MGVMDPERRFSRREEKRLLKLASEVSRTEFPNPERAGCPSPETLKALAQRQIPLEETGDAIGHIGKCSPCFAQYWEYRQAHKRVKTGRVLLLSLVIVALGGILVSRVGWRPKSREIAKDLPSPQVYRQLVLDLRAWSPSRSVKPADIRPELRLPRERIQLSIYLPNGSDDGTYELQLQAPGQPASLETRGTAQLRDHTEVLEVKVDTSTLRPGSYLLRLGHDPDGWSEYLIKLE